MIDNDTRRRGAVAAAFLLALATIAAGCAAPAPRREPAYLLRTDVAPDDRLAALQRMGPVTGHDDPAGYVQVLQKLITSDAQPDAMRTVAVDRLRDYDEPALRRLLIERITFIDRWPVLEHVFETAAAQGWTDFVPALVASYARPSRERADAQRPERRALARLRPGVSVEQTIFEVFDAPIGAVEPAHRTAAWVVLSRLGDPRPWLSEADSDAPLVRALHEAAELFDELPATPQACAMLTFARMGPHWARQRDAAAGWGDGLALRHLTLLGPPGMEPTTFADLARRLAAAQHVTRAERAGRDPTWTEDLAAWRDRLSPADVQLAALVLEAMGDRAVVAAWFDQADADHADTTSEHGGVLERTGAGGFEAVAWEPDLATHDRQFVASTRMLMRVAQGGLHYHFHAQSYRNGDYAGPGPGDLAFVDRYEIASLVLTFIDRDTLNVDYCQPGGVVIDLGCVTR